MEFIQYDELESRMVDYLNTDINLYSVGHEEMDKHWKFMLGNCTDITGYPYMGKTLLLMEKLFNLSSKHGTRHLLHLPDSGKPEEVVATIMQKITGKTFDKRYDNLINEKEVRENIYWLDTHFKILKYTKDKDGRMVRPTPKEFWDYSTEIDVHTASIDSWNYMKHEGSGHEYLADMLSYRNEIAELHKRHFFTIIHPKNTDSTCYSADGKLKAPDAYRLMGGSEWNNNGKNIISVHKDEKESQEYDIYYQKIKPRIVGRTGMGVLNYDIKLQKYWTAHEGERMYAFGHKEKWDNKLDVTSNPNAGMKNFMFDKDSGDVVEDDTPDYTDAKF